MNVSETKEIEQLEAELDCFDADVRENALSSLCEKVKDGEIELPQAGNEVNLHCHTFFSYNSYGYSPSKFAWLGRKYGLAVAGVVDFDVLDALEEFLTSGRMVNLKTVASLETRVFIPEFADSEITSPGEPGISYYMGVGFPRADYDGKEGKFLERLRQTSQDRNRELMERVNKYLKPIELDYEKEVISLTPARTPTERHICVAYARKAAFFFDSEDELQKYWVDKLGTEAGKCGLAESAELLNLIRAKTMKRGGVGYVQADPKSFPLLADMNEFCLACGAIPTITWLNGLSEGERQIERLVEVQMETGAAALNIIPDRNYTPGVDDEKLRNLYDVVELAEKLGLPVVCGTEMNSPGQKFVDSFETDELKPLIPVFLKGAHIVYAHQILQRHCGIGYLSGWASGNFKSVSEKNDFYETVGRRLVPERIDAIRRFNEQSGPQEILTTIESGI